MRQALTQLRLSARSLWRAPLASGFILATLALSIGASTGVFSIVYGVMLRALPYRSSEQLMWIASVRPDRNDAPFSLPEFMDYRERTRGAELTAYANWNATFSTSTIAQRLQGIRIAASAFDVLGVEPSAGRLFRESDDAVDAPPVVLLSYAFWQREFGGKATAVGQTIRLNGSPYTVVGVLPRHFPLTIRNLDVVIPLVPDLDPRRHARNSVNFLRIVGRLREGTSPDAAQREISSITAQLRTRFPKEYETKLGVKVTPLQRYLVGDTRLTLMVLLGCMTLMLGIALANVLNLLLIRATSRSGEIAVRRALGASGRNIASQLLAEGALLAGAGAIGGVSLAYWGVDLVTRSGAVDLLRLDEVRVDGAVLLFVAGLLAVATALFSLAPLGGALRAPPHAALRAAGRGGVGRRGDRWLRGLFVVLQVALAVILTATTSSLLQSLKRLERVELGYEPDSVFVARLSLPPQHYGTVADIVGFQRRLETALSQQAGVQDIGMISVAPLSGLLYSVPFTIPGQSTELANERTNAHYRAITAGYLTSVRTRVVRGRSFTDADDASAPAVALISKALADRYFGGRDPLGQLIRVNDNDTGARSLTIVGVVENTRHIDLESPPTNDIYIPISQVHRDGIGAITANQFWTVRTRTPAASFGPSFRKALHDVNPDVAASGSSSMTSYVDEAFAPRRFAVGLLLGVSFIALILAALGVYGVMAYSVSHQRRELGIRLALGARAGQLVGSVMSHAARLSSLGIGIGILGSIVSGRLVAGLLFGITATNVSILTGVSGLMAAVSFVASLIPALKAARVDPVTVLSQG